VAFEFRRSTEKETPGFRLQAQEYQNYDAYWEAKNKRTPPEASNHIAGAWLVATCDIWNIALGGEEVEKAETLTTLKDFIGGGKLREHL
jgi:hypothetical protein